MKLNTIKIENFLSVGEAFVDFEDFTELVHVVGVNHDTKPISSNGAGKSSIIEAIAFALFGKTIRKTTEKSLKNIHTKGKCKVTLTVNDNVVIERTKKPPLLKVTVDGENCTKEGINATQKYLETFLNTNSSIFLASIVFGQSNSTNFLTASAEEKRNIIQNFLSVSDLFKDRGRIKSLKQEHNNNKRVASTLLDDSISKINALKDRKKELIKMCKAVDSFLSSEKASFIKAHTISEIQELERAHHELEISYNNLTQLKSEKVGVIKRALDRIKKYEGGTCDHCGKVQRKSWDIIQTDKEVVESSVKELDKLKSSLRRVEEEFDASHIPITAQDFELIEQVKSFESELKVLNLQLREQKKFHKKYFAEVAKSQKSYDIMRFWETAFSEQGLVKYVIRNILSFFNERSNYYLGFLTNGSFSIEFDELLHDVIKNKSSHVFFDALSGGEKKKLSLAVMLALNDLLLLTGKDRSNVVFFDEIADSLDEEGIKGLYELIQQLTTKKRVFIITHNDNLSSLIEDWSDVLKVSKTKHITTITKV